MLAKIVGEVGDAETLVISKWIDDDKKHRCDYYLGCNDAAVDVVKYGRVIKSAYRIEGCFKRAKSECGLSDYQVRNWRGWHHHVTLSQLAMWFLTEELLRQKKGTDDELSADSGWCEREDSRGDIVVVYT